MSFLGHVISNGGITVNPSKVDAMVHWEAPKSVTEIRSFLRLDGYYKRFIEGFFKLSIPLTQLTRKGQGFMSGMLCEKNFRELKKRLIITPVLILPDPKEPFVVYCDTSKIRLELLVTWWHCTVPFEPTWCVLCVSAPEVHSRSITYNPNGLCASERESNHWSIAHKDRWSRSEVT